MDDDLEYNVNIVRSLIEKGKKYDEESIDIAIDKFRKIEDLDEEMVDKIRKTILSIYGHRLDMGAMITDNSQEPWFMARTKDCEMICSERNRLYLLQDCRLSPDVVSKLDSITDVIMDGLGDPQKESFNRRGLIMGDVQSGKTNAYTRLCCKAVDAGYRMIILMTGTLESLRRQTQGRLDEALVGKDSAIFIKKNASKYIGVGNINPKCDFAVFTSTDEDFKGKIAEALNLPICNLGSPLLLVIKKNSKIINNLADWFEKHSDLPIESPLLLIDDEADNASINTSRDSITAVNSGIRKLLGMFRKNTYIGFTATPYANIFIDSDDSDDLYPRHFIYCLRSPSNYVGPSSVYQDDGRHHYMLKRIYLHGDDQKNGLPELPYKHKKDFIMDMKTMPESLRDAIECFVISCAIRDIRGMNKSHMSMLINASRFTDVQESIRDSVEEYVFQLKAAIESFSGIPTLFVRENQYLDRLYRSWENNYKECEPDWKKIQKSLISASKPIIVKSVNQRNGAKSLRYDEYKNDGMRVIAVGGNSLSRGLTLEGLCISYFYRRAESYDTLMQMGRWFGYREGYADLCRIWMTEENIEWYEQISVATEELKREFIMMSNKNKTPVDFGFRVRSDIVGLLVTARNKMRHAGDDCIYGSIDGSPIWTSYVYVTRDRVAMNEWLLEELIKKLINEKRPIFNNYTKNYVFPNVSYTYIRDFLEKYEYPKSKDLSFDTEAIVGMMGNGQLSVNWDVAIQHGDGEIYNKLEKYGLSSIKMARRTSYSIKDDHFDEKCIRFTSSALMSPHNMSEGIFNDYSIDDEKLPVSDCDLDGFAERVKKLEDEYKIKMGEGNEDKAFTAKTYLATSKRRPIMILYPLQLGINEKTKNENKTLADDQNGLIKDLEGLTPIGVALGFPMMGDDGRREGFVMKYKTSTVYEKMGGNEDLDEED